MRRHERETGEPVATRRTRFFVAGVAVLWLGADWPIHDLAERYLYLVHMSQHLLFTLIAAAAADRRDAGVAPAPLPRGPEPVATAFGFLTRPLVALIVFNGVLLFMHWPAVVTLSVRIRAGSHFGLHVLLVSTALLMWWPIMSPLPEYAAAPGARADALPVPAVARARRSRRRS